MEDFIRFALGPGGEVGVELVEVTAMGVTGREDQQE
jgi:hypothetical protein